MSVELIDIERFVPDILTELPDCPIPAIERRILDAVIEACERAHLWEAQLPEIPVAIGQTCFDLPAPPGQSKVHDIVRLTLDNCFLRNVPLEETRDNVYATIPYRGQAFHVLKRGQVGLNIAPTKASDPFAGSAFVVLPPVGTPPVEPVDPGAVAPAIISEFDIDDADIYNQSVNHPTFSLGNTRAFHGGGATGSNATVIEEAQRNETSGVFYWETVLDGYTNPSSNNRMLAGITQEVPIIDTTGVAGTSQSIGVAANNGGSAIRDVYQVGAVIYTRTGSEIIENSVVRHLLDLDTGTYSVAVDAEAFEQVITGLDTTNPWFPFTEQGRSGAGLIGGAWILRTVNDQFDYDIPAGADVFGTNSITQDDIDAYEAAVAQYFVDLAVYNAANQTPIIPTITPIDPGAVGSGTEAILDTATQSGGGGVISNDDRTHVKVGGGYASAQAIAAGSRSSGQWYWETVCDFTGAGEDNAVGITRSSPIIGSYLGNGGDALGIYNNNTLYSGGSNIGGIGGFTTGQLIQHELDLDAGTYRVNINGAGYVSVFVGLPAGDYFPGVTNRNSGSFTFNFTESDWVGTAPAGFESLSDLTTQAEVDAYNAALQVAIDAQAQQDALDAAMAATGPRNCFGIEIAVTLKPTREADRIPYCFYRDYYQLVIDGALGYAFGMHGSPWYDRAQADKRRQAFEYEIAKAKQGMDRGFSDRPLQARPRTF